MNPATSASRRPPPAERLLVLDPNAGPSGRLRQRLFRDLPQLLRPDDLVVLNDAATLPASVQGRTEAGEPIEIRLARYLGGSGGSDFQALLLGEGDWHQPTEERPDPPQLHAGSQVTLSDCLKADIGEVSPLSRRWARITLRACSVDTGLGSVSRIKEAWLRELYRVGRPIQYSYLRAPLEVWEVQNAYASRPWAMEMPSAGHLLRGDTLQALRERGVNLATITHAAGISSTGDPRLDSLLPLPERYEIPEATAEAIWLARSWGRRILAVGTSVVRALEGARLAGGGTIHAGAAETDLMIGPGFQPAIVDGVLSGMHESGESHFRLLRAFTPQGLLQESLRLAEREGYLNHEFGDACLVWRAGAIAHRQPAAAKLVS